MRLFPRRKPLILPRDARRLHAQPPRPPVLPQHRLFTECPACGYRRDEDTIDTATLIRQLEQWLVLLRSLPTREEATPDA